MPVKTWATNDVPTASDFNTHFRDQVVSTVTSGTRPSGTEGQIIYETDTNLLYVYDGSGWVRFGASGGWTTYTPTLTQSAAVTKTVTYAKYEKVGRMVSVSWLLDVTGTGTAANAVTVSLPFTAATSLLMGGSGMIYDSSANTIYPGLISLASTTTASYIDATTTTGAGQALGNVTFTAALASGDAIRGSITYESTT
jgi:hypothetical protein